MVCLKRIRVRWTVRNIKRTLCFAEAVELITDDEDDPYVGSSAFRIFFSPNIN